MTLNTSMSEHGATRATPRPHAPYGRARREPERGKR
jgi:hypothetical protein